MFQKILVAIDESDVSQQALTEAIALAKTVGARLMLVHVLAPFSEAYPNPIFPGPDSVYPGFHTEALKAVTQNWEAYEQEKLVFLRDRVTQARTAGVATEYTQPLGDPGQVICTLARTWGADLIIMGRRGRRGLGEWLLGSVSNYVNHHTPCSVLTVQKPASVSPPLASANSSAVNS